MGEYARFRGEEIKIGTCEDMFYLRADQCHLIQGYPFSGGERFRFPWPDEDHQEPGSFDPYNRTCPLDRLTAPLELGGQHYSVQFVAQAGYNASLPCPEAHAPAAGSGRFPVAGVWVARNGFRGAVLLCQQKRVDGQLVGIAECGGCGLKWRLSAADARQAAAALIEEGDRLNSDWYRQVAARLAAGYGDREGN